MLTLFALAGSICLIIYAITDNRNLLQKGKYVYAERLIKGGQYIEAVTCGVELIGRIKVNSVVKPMYLKLTRGIAEQFQIATDDKNRVFIGYVVLCRYQAPDGTIHIFASKGRLGEPDREYKGETVKVYYSGDGFKYYHVALPEMSKQDGIL